MKTYYTHSGIFHADEITGYIITKLANVCNEVVRLDFKKDDILPIDGIVSDIGRQYNPDKNLFDHHQGLLLRPNGYPLASAGLLWKQFGKSVVKEILPFTEHVDEVWELVDKNFIQGLDAHDADSNYNVTTNCIGGKVSVLTLPNIIYTYNTDPTDNPLQLSRFLQASELIQQLLIHIVEKCEQKIVDENNFRKEVVIKSNIVILNKYCNWKGIIHNEYPNIDFVIQPSGHPENPFSMVAVPINPNSRIVKVPIERPDWFTGFIHQGKWIAGGESVEQLIKLAQYQK